MDQDPSRVQMVNEPPKDENVPVTVVVTRVVKPGHEKDFELWQEKIIQETAKVEGYLGVSVIRPKDPKHPEYVTIFTFDQYSNLKRWFDSEIRKRLLAESRSFAPDDPKMQILTGLESWFTLPGHAMQAPENYKMVLVTTVIVYVLVNSISFVTSPLIGTLPLFGQTAFTTPITCAIMTYWAMPKVTRLLRRWLYP